MEIPGNDLFKNGNKLPVIEEFYSLQGEGYNTGKPAYFIRVGGCDICCAWCDSKVSWNMNEDTLTDISNVIENTLKCGAKAIVVTGGEPLLYNLDSLCNELKKYGIITFLETSGSYPLSGKWDWICLSPKKQNPPIEEVVLKANELKVVIFDESDFEWAETCASMVSRECKLFLQPEWSKYKQNIGTIVEYIKRNIKWRISLQSHKFMRIP